MRPQTFQTDLLPHQGPAVAKLARPRVGGLFAEMGLGKCRMAQELVARRVERTSRALIFCPVNLKATWAHELRKHLREPRIYTFDDRTEAGKIPAADWYLIGIESMSQSDRVVLAANSLTDREATLIVDESQLIKGHRASRTHWITLIGERAKYRLILTGTPLSQGVQDLYAQMRFLSPDILGYRSWYSFAANHLEYDERIRGRIVRAHNTAYLAARIAPYVYQITKDECLNLPPKLYTQRYFSMTRAQRELYERAKAEILADITDHEWETGVYIYRLFTALQQIVCGFWNRFPLRHEPPGEPTLLEVDHDRDDMLMFTLAELPPDRPVVIWTRYRRCVVELGRRITADYGVPPARFYGDLSDTQRQAELARWRRGETRHLVATPGCGGFGLTLTEADTQVFHANDFQYAKRVQTEDRLHRIGQTRPVTCVDLVCSPSIDDRTQAAHARKGNTAHEFRRHVDQVRVLRGKAAALKLLREEL